MDKSSQEGSPFFRRAIRCWSLQQKDPRQTRKVNLATHIHSGPRSGFAGASFNATRLAHPTWLWPWTAGLFGLKPQSLVMSGGVSHPSNRISSPRGLHPCCGRKSSLRSSQRLELERVSSRPFPHCLADCVLNFSVIYHRCNSQHIIRSSNYAE